MLYQVDFSMQVGSNSVVHFKFYAYSQDTKYSIHILYFDTCSYRLWHNKLKVLFLLMLLFVLATVYHIDGDHQQVLPISFFISYIFSYIPDTNEERCTS